MGARLASDDVVAARNAVRACLSDLREGDVVLVACSGGADSLALAATTAWVAQHDHLSVAAIVVDHQAQPGSADVARRAADACRSLGIAEVDVVAVHLGTEGGFEAAAREARYSALERAASARGARAVLLGHTLDDQAETVLLRLARGSGARSLSAMSAVSGLWRRPLLALRRDRVRTVAIESLQPLGLKPWEDPHNADHRYARVRVRSTLAQLEADLGEGVVESLGRTAQLLKADADHLDGITDATWQRLVTSDVASISASVDELAALAEAIRWRVLRRMPIELGAPEEDIGFEVVLRLDAFITDWHGQGAANLPVGIRAERSYGRLSLHRPELPVSKEG